MVHDFVFVNVMIVILYLAPGHWWCMALCFVMIVILHLAPGPWWCMALPRMRMAKRCPSLWVMWWILTLLLMVGRWVEIFWFLYHFPLSTSDCLIYLVLLLFWFLLCRDLFFELSCFGTNLGFLISVSFYCAFFLIFLSVPFPFYPIHLYTFKKSLVFNIMTLCTRGC